jgi:Ubiquitin family
MSLTRTLKQQVFQRENVPVPQQRVSTLLLSLYPLSHFSSALTHKIVYAGKDLDDAKTIGECNIKKEAIIHLILKASEKNLQTYTETQKVCK